MINRHGGMHSIEWDVIRSISWALISSGGAMSDIHFDAGGFCTWARSDMGAKVWGYCEPMGPAATLIEAMKLYHRLATTETAKLEKVVKPVQVLLTPGVTL